MGREATQVMPCMGDCRVVPVRDNFSRKVRDILAGRAGHKCSVCEKTTSGPSTEPKGVLSDGVAAHITAASPGGPRFNPTLSFEERRSVENGIWACTQHGREIDADRSGYSVATLQGCKRRREETAAKELGNAASAEDQSACVMELPNAENPYKVFEIIQPQPYTYATTLVLREQTRRAQRPWRLLDLASKLIRDTWHTHPEVVGILSTWVGNNSDIWQPRAAEMAKMEQLCKKEIGADDWTLVGSTNPLAFALATKGYPEIYTKALERTICNRHWRDADAAHARRYYGTLGAELSAIIRHWEEGLRHDLLRAYDAPRIIDLLLMRNKDPKWQSIHHWLLDLLANQAKILHEGGEINLARHVAQGLGALRQAQKE
jgi:hypothetical protein